MVGKAIIQSMFNAFDIDFAVEKTSGEWDTKK